MVMVQLHHRHLYDEDCGPRRPYGSALCIHQSDDDDMHSIHHGPYNKARPFRLRQTYDDGSLELRHPYDENSTLTYLDVMTKLAFNVMYDED